MKSLPRRSSLAPLLDGAGLDEASSSKAKANATCPANFSFASDFSISCPSSRPYLATAGVSLRVMTAAVWFGGIAAWHMIQDRDCRPPALVEVVIWHGKLTVDASPVEEGRDANILLSLISALLVTSAFARNRTNPFSSISRNSMDTIFFRKSRHVAASSSTNSSTRLLIRFAVTKAPGLISVVRA